MCGLTLELELRGGQGEALAAVGGRPPRLLQRIVRRQPVKRGVKPSATQAARRVAAAAVPHHEHTLGHDGFTRKVWP
jgi:hypothetical protein